MQTFETKFALKKVTVRDYGSISLMFFNAFPPTIKKLSSFQASITQFLTIYLDFCLKLKSRNEQLLANKYKRLKSKLKIGHLLLDNRKVGQKLQ